MRQVGLLVRLQARPGQEKTVADFLEGAVTLAEQEMGTPVWITYQIGSSTFGIFDLNSDDAARQAHLNGEIAAMILKNADAWLSEPPQIEFHHVLSQKLPGSSRTTV